MAIEVATITVGNAAAVELTSTGQATGDRDLPSFLRVTAPAEALFVGPAGVTTATGYPVAANTQLVVELQPGEQLFGIIAGLTPLAVKVFRTGV